MVQHFKAVPDFRGRFESYPLWSMLTILFLATLCGAPRGQKDIAKFARGLSQAQRRALGIRRNRQGKYPAPTQPTFCRMLQRVDAAKVEQAILAIQEQWRGPAPKDQLIVLDGKQPRHGTGTSILSAVTVPSQHYLGSALVDQKTNEIAVARELFNRLELVERLVSLDALHTYSTRSQLKDCGVSDFPIPPSFVHRLQTPIVPRPTASQARIALVNRLEQFVQRLPC